MPHIHTLPGQIDHTAEIYIVDTETKTIMLRVHDKYHMWFPVGGHIELNETGEQAAHRETMEEVGLTVELWRDYARDETFPKGGKEIPCLPPYHMNTHPINEEHRHLSHIYYAKALTKNVVQGETEKSDNIKWWTKEELESTTEVAPAIKWYALDALDKLCK